jgi:hypothetical protein
MLHSLQPREIVEPLQAIAAPDEVRALVQADGAHKKEVEASSGLEIRPQKSLGASGRRRRRRRSRRRRSGASSAKQGGGESREEFEHVSVGGCDEFS